MNRRNFFSMLAGLPFVGSWIAPKDDKPDVFRKPAFWIWRHGEGKYQFEEVSIDRDERQKQLEFHVTRLEHEVADLNSTLEVIEKNHIEWISVKERLPELAHAWNEWTCDEPKCLIPIGNTSKPVLVSRDMEQSTIGYYVKYDDENPEWIVVDRGGMGWGTPVTHWAEFPSGFSASKADIKSAWDVFRNKDKSLILDRIPQDERTVVYSVAMNPLKSSPPKSSRDRELLLVKSSGEVEIGYYADGFFDRQQNEIQDVIRWGSLMRNKRSEPS